MKLNYKWLPGGRLLAPGCVFSAVSASTGKVLELAASIYNVFDENYAASGSEKHLQNDMEQDGRFTVPGAEYLVESCRQLEVLGREGEVNNTIQRLIETEADYENVTGVQEADRLRKVG